MSPKLWAMSEFEPSSRFGLLRQLTVAVIWISAVSVIGQNLTDLGPWYQALKQPPWKPPDWAFGLIWTSVFVLIVIAGVLAWRKTHHPAQRVQIVALFAINSMLHMLWSMLFFTVKRPDWAMIELVFLNRRNHSNVLENLAACCNSSAPVYRVGHDCRVFKLRQCSA